MGEILWSNRRNNVRRRSQGVEDVDNRTITPIDKNTLMNSNRIPIKTQPKTKEILMDFDLRKQK